MIGKVSVRGCCLALSIAWLASTVGAQAPVQEDRLKSSFIINDEDPESSVPTVEEANLKPLQMGYHIMLLSERAEAATLRGDHAAAARYWRALGKASPDRALPFVRACRSFEDAGDLDNAVQDCRAAVSKAGVTVADNLRFVELLLKQPRQLSDNDIADVEATAQHLRDALTDESAEVQQNRVLCLLGSRLSDKQRLERCTKRLRELAPDDPQTFVFSWSLAMLERDFDRAESVLASAKRANLTSDALGPMQTALRGAREQQSSSKEQSLTQSRVFRGALALLALGAMMLIAFKLKHRLAQT